MTPEKKSQRLQVVFRVVEEEERKATEAVQASRSRLQQEQRRLLELQTWYYEYEKMICSRREGMRASEISRGRHFLTELARMQDQQTQHISQLESDLGTKLDAWRASHLRYQSLEKLIARARRDENLLLDKKEQKMLDDWFAGRRLKKD